VSGTAEATSLPDAGVDAITAGQAFHWFELDATRAEWARILRPGGWVALFWNHRRRDTPFLDGYEAVHQAFGIDYREVKAEWAVSERLDRLFGGAFESRVFPHAKTFDLEGVKGLARSASYAPPPGHVRHEPMMREIERLFARHARDGVVRVDFDTKLYFGRLGSGVRETWRAPSA
jgi:hypothetical protein